MGSIAKWISSRINTFLIGTVEVLSGFIIETSLFSPSGDDSPPLKEDKVYIVKTKGSGRFVCVGSLCISQGANPGEKILYSRDSAGDIKSKVYLNAAGEIVLNDGTGFAVEFNELKKGIDQIREDLNSLGEKHNIHSHVTTATVGATAVPGVISPTVSTEVPSTASIDSSKVEKVRL